jgi:hypothetical protein
MIDDPDIAGRAGKRFQVRRIEGEPRAGGCDQWAVVDTSDPDADPLPVCAQDEESAKSLAEFFSQRLNEMMPSDDQAN